MDGHLRDLRYFVAVAEELNFTRASERVHVSQPALSKQIRALEKTLRARLFDRDGKRVELTGAGRALLAAAPGLLAAWDDAVDAVSEAAGEDARELRVGTLTSIGRALYPGVVKHYESRQPGWHLSLRSFAWGDPTAGLRDKASDAAFLWLPIDAENIAWETLVSERRFIAVSDRHRLARHASVTFADIADEPLVALPKSAGPLREFWLATDARGGNPAHVAAEASSADETFEIVAAGGAAVLLAEGNADVYSRPGITCLPVEDLGEARLAVAWRRSDRRLAVASFVQACADAITDGVDSEAERGSDSKTAHQRQTPRARPPRRVAS